VSARRRRKAPPKPGAAEPGKPAEPAARGASDAAPADAGPVAPPPSASGAREAARLASKGELYDRYRDALRGGHLASLRGNIEVAGRAYLEAAALLPDRAAPYVGLGRAELAANRPVEALAAFEHALRRAPGDPGALDGSSRALLAQGRTPEAADMLDRLAITLLEQDRHADALATIERALELAESRWRRGALERLRAEQGATDSSWLGDLSSIDRERMVGAGAADVPTALAAPPPVSDALRTVAAQVEAASAAGDVQGLVRGALALARADRLRAAIDACHDALSVAPADPDVHRALAVIYRRRGWALAAREKLSLVDRYLEAVDDPHELDRLAETAETAGDLDSMLAIVDRHAHRARLATALELCFRALELAPSDVRVHLAIARLHLVLGWRRRAVDEVTRLARLVELSGDADGRERVAAFVNGELLGSAGVAASGA
jgi:tetratricopeptide (TPR) repeat protein